METISPCREHCEPCTSHNDVIHLWWRLCDEFLGKMAESSPDPLAAQSAFSNPPVDRNWSWPLCFIDECIRHRSHLPPPTCQGILAGDAYLSRAGRAHDG